MRFAFRRLGFFLLTLWVALTLNFALPRLMPGNPALAIVGKFRGGISPQAVKVLEAQFGVGTHQNLVAQYFRYLGSILHGDFGPSYQYRDTTVNEIIREGFPVDVAVGGTALASGLPGW